MPRWRDFDFFPPSTPIAVKGGIKAHTKRGAFGAQWWGKRWIAALESLNVGGRLDRGRSYARKGQVVSLEIGSGLVTAEVQGSRPRPYKVTIELKPIAAKGWKVLAARFAESPLVLAKLLAGEMPEAIEDDLRYPPSWTTPVPPPASTSSRRPGPISPPRVPALIGRTRASTSRRFITSWRRSSTAIRS